MEKEQLMNEVLQLGSDRVDVFGGTYEGGIYLQQNPKEITSLILFLDGHKPYKNFLEVGSAAGGNTYILNKYFNFEKVVIVDDNKHEKWQLRSAILKDIDRVEYIGDSQSKEAHDFVVNMNIKFDVMFIDADHSYEGVKNDTHSYIEFLKSGGYVIYHDTVYMETITKWVNEMKDNAIDGLIFVDTYADDMFWPKGISVFQKK